MNTDFVGHVLARSYLAAIVHGGQIKKSLSLPNAAYLALVTSLHSPDQKLHPVIDDSAFLLSRTIFLSLLLMFELVTQEGRSRFARSFR